MAIKKYVAISYCFAFLAVYFCSMAYAFLSTSINENYNVTLPQTEAMNESVSAISDIVPWSGVILAVGVTALVLAVLFIIFSSRAMASAM